MLAAAQPKINSRYTPQDFANITFGGFEIKLPDETIQIITELAAQVGSPTYIRTPTFQKQEINNGYNNNGYNDNGSGGGGGGGGFGAADNSFKKKKRGKPTEIVNDSDWENLRSFQATEIVQKAGLDAQIDNIRSSLNKMTDKNYNEQRGKIMEILDKVIEQNTDTRAVDMLRVGNAIFEIASNNRFYSKLYADLYCDLIDKYEIMTVIFETSLNSFLELFNHIEWCSAEENYDRFCKINKDNEKRKALSAFIVNLTLNKIISKTQLVNLTFNLLEQVWSFIKLDNKKNEVDEMVENIAILYNKECFKTSVLKIDGLEFIEVITTLAHSKTKSYASLSNKTIFKFMDMIDM
jgi:hypothetical protein